MKKYIPHILIGGAVAAFFLIPKATQAAATKPIAAPGTDALPAPDSSSITSSHFADITDVEIPRGCDPRGCGHYHASRGSRLHDGVDLRVHRGQSIYSPIDGVVYRHSVPYLSDPSYRGIEIHGIGAHAPYEIKIFYMSPSVPVSRTVARGELVGAAQSISDKYPGMIDHIHLEVKRNGIQIDPTNLVFT